MLDFLAEDEVEHALFYFNDYTVSTPDFMNRFNRWLEVYDQNEAAWKEGAIAIDTYQTERSRLLASFKIFLEDIANGDLLIDNFLVKRIEDLQNQINQLNAQKAYDEVQVQQLRSELELVRALNLQTRGLSLKQVDMLYRTIATHDLLNAAENLYKSAREIDIGLGQQAEQIYDNLIRVDRSRQEMGLETYQKESSKLTEGLLVTINELWRDRPAEEMSDPDLLQYFRTRAQNLLESGQVKQVLDYLLNALHPANALMEDTVSISSRYYLLEAAQYQENIDYKSVLDQLNATTRYVQNIIQSESLNLRSTFAEEEMDRVEQALNNLSRRGKSKRFNIRDDGDYQELDAARDFLRKFL